VEFAVCYSCAALVYVEVALLTFLPALEIALGDKIFWPGLNGRSKTSSNRKNILKRVAAGTLKKKVPIVVIISVLSIGAMFVTFMYFGPEVSPAFPFFCLNSLALQFLNKGMNAI
jgi:predicted MFS family arabinose efflux permease